MKKTNPKNNLLLVNPSLAKEWHPTKNGKLSPKDVTPGSQKKAWWKCPKGDDHEWEAVISDRNRGFGCAVCSNYKVVKSNCLATLNPKLAKEWHPKKNGKLTPEEVHPGSSKKVWWKCPKGDDHEWKAAVYSRTGGRGCPICSGRQVVKSTCLATVNSKLAKEWHPTKNGALTPHDVGINSGKKVWWKCSKGDDHEWEATVHNRTSGLNCPVCSNQKVVNSNCLATLNPELAKEWHPTKNGKLTPYDVGAGSGKVVWWRCQKGEDHIWRGSILKRNNGRGCPVCAGRKVVKSNSLAILNPELTKEWHPTKNKDFTPYDVRPGSNIKIWWQCLKRPDHVWRTSVTERRRGTGCPICNDSSSVPELRIYSELKSIFQSTQHRANLKGYEVDVYIPEIQVGVEYDGAYWHRDNIHKDQKKNSVLNSVILLIRIREKGLPKLSNTDIEVNKKNISVTLIKKILHLILEHRKIESADTLDKTHEYFGTKDWIASDRFNKLLAERNNIDFEKSFGHLFPDVAKEWHPTKNDPLLPEHFTPGSSSKKIWWQCQKRHEWQARIPDRAKGVGCPYCSGRKKNEKNQHRFSF